MNPGLVVVFRTRGTGDRLDRFGGVRMLGGRHRTGRIAAVVLTVVLALAAAACTKSSKKSSSGAGSTSATKGSVPTTAPGTKATGTPVKIGLANTESGPSAIPELKLGRDLAIKRINDYENGLNGHPIDLIVCATDGTPESSAACANRFVSEHVAAVIEGSELGSDAKIPILKDAGIATVGTSTIGTGQSLNQDAFFWSPAATSFPAIEVDLAAQLGVKNFTFLVPDVPQVPILSSIVEKQTKLHGMKYNLVKFDQAAPDFAAAIAAAQSNGSDGIATIATDDWCTGELRAAKSANYTGKYILGQCIRFVTDLGPAAAAGYYTISPTWKPTAQRYAPAEAKTVLDEFAAMMTKAGKTKEIVGLAWLGYSSIVQSADALRAVEGEYTAARVMDALRNLSNAPNPLGEPITCNPRPMPGFSGCTQGWLEFVQQRDGSSKPLSNEFVKVKQ